MGHLQHVAKNPPVDSIGQFVFVISVNKCVISAMFII